MVDKPTLKGLLEEYYRAKVVNKSDTAPIILAMREALEDDTVKREAAQRLTSLKAVSQRCFISRIQADALSEAING